MQPVTIYTTPYCPYCIRAKMLLDERGGDRHIDQVAQLRVDRRFFSEGVVVARETFNKLLACGVDLARGHAASLGGH